MRRTRGASRRSKHDGAGDQPRRQRRDDARLQPSPRAPCRPTVSPRAASSTAHGRCAFAFDGRAMTGLRRRYARLGASRQRRAPRRALLQVPPSPRHPLGRSRGAERARRAAHRRAARAEHARDRDRALRRARGAKPEPLALARLRPLGRQRLVLALHQGGLLLQDLHVAGGAVGEALRAADPPRRRARPRRRRRGSGPLRESLRLLRRAGDRLGSGRAVGGARGRSRRRSRHPVRGRFRARRPAAVGAAGGRRRRGPCLGSARRGRAREPAGGADPAPHERVRRLRPRHLRRGRARRRPSRGAAGASAAPARLAHRREAHGRSRAGAIERPMVFAGNDRPGRDARRRRSHLSQPLRRRARAPRGRLHERRRRLGARSPISLAPASRLRPWSMPAPAVDEAVAAQADRARASCSAPKSFATRGFQTLAAVAVRDAAGRVERIACDLLAMSNGWNPTVHLTCHLGGKPRLGRQPSRLSCRARCRPAWRSPARRRAGSRSPTRLRTGRASAARRRPPAASRRRRRPRLRRRRSRRASTPLWKAPVKPGKAFVDFQNDVTAADVALAHREGFRAVEHLKRYTTLGMATDQGKTSNLPGLAMMAALTGTTIPEVGTTVFRPPYTPVAIGALAGHHRGREFRPTRLTPAHAWAEEQGAVFVEAGAWLRAQYFPRAGERDWLATVNREVATVRGRRRRLRRLDASARSTSRAPTRPSSSSASTSTAGNRSPSGAPATASCCARTASSWTTARPRASARRISS